MLKYGTQPWLTMLALIALGWTPFGNAGAGVPAPVTVIQGGAQLAASPSAIGSGRLYQSTIAK